VTTRRGEGGERDETDEKNEEKEKKRRERGERVLSSICHTLKKTLRYRPSLRFSESELIELG
jgi:hypothetical protein